MVNNFPRFLSKSSIHCFRVLLLILIVLGISLRLLGLPQKNISCDESLTLIRTSGHNVQELLQDTFRKGIITFSELNQYQYITPEQPLRNTLDALRDHPEHSPLYYLMAHFWRRFLGESIVTTRWLSLLISLITLPLLYWLCRKLFKSPKIGWIAVAVFSISPMHIYYANDAREYSLWILTTILCTLSLLFALEGKSRFWSLYGITLCLNLYTYLFSPLLLLAHGTYILLIQRLQLNKIVLLWLGIALTNFVLFLLWPFVFTEHYKIFATTGFAQASLSPFNLFTAWIQNLTFIFFDSSVLVQPESSDSAFWIGLILMVCIGLSAKSMFKESNQAALLLSILMIVSFIPLAMIDLYMSWRISSQIRYLIPLHIAEQLFVAYGLSKMIDYWMDHKKTVFNTSKQVIIQLMIIGLFCYPIAIQVSQTWQGKHEGFWYSANYGPVVSVLNQSQNSLLINTSSASLCYMLAMSHSLNPQISLLLLSGFHPLKNTIHTIGPFQKDFDQIFIFDIFNVAERYELPFEDVTQRQLKVQTQSSHLRVQTQRFQLWKLSI